MKTPGNETIAAAATAAGGGIGIIRISGTEALAVAGRVFRDKRGRQIAAAPPFLLVLGSVADPHSGEPIDEVLAVHMPGGRSYTGEPTVEIQAHGGRVVLESVLQATLRAGARLAEPGEFTKRAFLSGRLDLSQAEAVADIIGAESQEARRSALGQLHGKLGAGVIGLRERLLDLVARLEAALDFEDEEAPASLPSTAQIAALACAVRELSAQASDPPGERAGLRVAFAGRSNAGKSSIFNYLLNTERAIVAPFPGTTRDYIEERSVIGGASVTLIDTAGLRPADDFVEAEGVRRSVRQVEAADIVVLVLDGSALSHPDDARLFQLTVGRDPLVAISKADLPPSTDLRHLQSQLAGLAMFTLSTVTGEGFPAFTEALASRCRAALPPATPAPGVVPNIRHRDALERAARHIAAAAERSAAGDGLLDQVVAELRAALSALGEITGETVTEEILERIFSGFCVGK